MSKEQMIRIGQMADLHLGFRQYGLIERAEDFWNAARVAAQKLADANVQAVLIPGDIYHDKRPYPVALRHALRVLALLKEKNIPVYATRGNHDASYAWRERQGGDSLNLLDDLGLITYIQDEVIEPEHTNIRIWGLGYYGKATGSKLAELVENKKDLLKEKSKPNILMMHAFLDSMVQGEDLSEYEVGIHDFDYVAIGHYHKWWTSGSGKLLSSGSTEHTLSSDWDEVQRSVAIVDFRKKKTGWQPSIERVKYNVRPKIIKKLELGLVDADDAMTIAKEAIHEIDTDNALIQLEIYGKLKEAAKSIDTREIANSASKASKSVF